MIRDWIQIHKYTIQMKEDRIEIPEFRGRRRRYCWGKSLRTWLLNKFISFLAVLRWKSDKNQRQGLYKYRNSIESIWIFSYDAWEIGLKKYPKSVHFHTIWGSVNDKVKVEKMTKINLKPCTLLQTRQKTSAKFQKDRFKIVWKVAITRHLLSIRLRSENDKVQKVLKTKWQKIRQGLYEKHMHIFRLWRWHVQSCKKINIKLYEELCSRSSPCLYIGDEKWLSLQCGKSDKK